MTATLQHFTRALLTPDLSLTTLIDAHTMVDSHGMPRLMRTTRFAEAEIEWHGERWLLAMPLTPAALLRIERTASYLKRLNTPHLAMYKILPGEMRWQDTTGNEHFTDLVLQHMPAGRKFADAIFTEEKATLLTAVEVLRNALQELKFRHNNLTEKNLRWCDGRLIPIRYYDACVGSDDTGPGDDLALEALKHRIAEAPLSSQTVSDITVAYDPQSRLTGHRWTSHVFEGLVLVEDEAGFGYVDTENCPVIPAQFVWADDFHEGRAEVQTPTGMGLIDRQGRYVIAPEHEIVDYDPVQSVVRVRDGGCWAEYDYLGRRVTEYSREEKVEVCGSEIC